MSQIADAIHRMTSQLSGDLHRVEGAVKLSNVELAAIAATTLKTAVTVSEFRTDVSEDMAKALDAQERQTSAVVQLDSVRTITEARALTAKTQAFAKEVDDRFSKAVEGVVLNRILYDKHFAAIEEEYQSKIRTIGSHIFDIWDKDIRPAERAAKVPAAAYQGLAVEIDLERLAARSSLLESDLDMIRDKHLQPLVALDAQVEETVKAHYAIDGAPAAGTQVLVPAVVAFTDNSSHVLLDVAAGANGTLTSRDTLPEYAKFCKSEEGRATVRRACRIRPMTDDETSQLLAAIGRLAERGLVDEWLVPSYQRYVQASKLGIVDSAVVQPERGRA